MSETSELRYLAASFQSEFGKNLEILFLITCRYDGIGQNISRPTVPLTNLQKVSDIIVNVSALVRVSHTRWPAVLPSSSPPGSPTSHSGNPSSLHHFIMKGLDQGHLYPKLEVPGLTCPGWESNEGLRSGRELEKSHSNSLLIAIRTTTYEPTTWLPPVHCYMN